MTGLGSDAGQLLRPGVTVRALILGVILAPCAAWLNTSVEAVRYAGQPTTVSLFPHLLAMLFGLIGANRGVAWFRPRWSMRPSELVTVYFFVLMASVMAAHDTTEVLTPILTYPARFATAANGWAREITPRIPGWLLVTDREAVASYYTGGARFWTWDAIRPWVGPVVIWSAFLSILAAGISCLNIVLRRRWALHERLSYPLAQLPIDLVQPRVPLFSARMFWIAFVLAALHDSWFGLHTLWPSIPEPYTRWQTLQQNLTSPPWNAIASLPLAFYPWITCLGVFLPTDFLASCCVFFWVWKLQPVVATAYGYTDIPGFPFVNEQSFGGYVSIALLALWGARRELSRALGSLRRPPSDAAPSEARLLRAATVGAILSAVVAFAFFLVCGMSAWVVAAVLGIYAIAAIAITRLRAELGTPAHDLGQMGPMRLIPLLFGTSDLTRTDLAMLAPIHGFNRNYRACPMAVSAEALQAADRTRQPVAAMFCALTLAVVWGVLCGFGANLHLHYQWGAGARADSPYVSMIFGREPYDHVTNLMRNGISATQRQTASGAVAAGFAVTTLLAITRARIVGWPLHPAGYAVSSNWGMSLMWFSLTIAWAAKLLITRFGGLRLYRQAQPLLMGVLMGECCAGTVWMLITTLTGAKTFILWPYG